MSKRNTDLTIYILLVLLQKPMKGYDISKEVTRISEGEVKVLNASPYAKLKKMLERGLIEITAETNENRKVIYYGITDKGRETINKELKNLEILTFRIKKTLEVCKYEE
ncbi:PadR family transcriptional regulator [Vallitalea guaymasensis]|uniref:Helix-turn-helix transcriptional regulator n=1 Tax=Vallitalea guaymasensis TaxID=1185412 RepID=A0A8J8MDU9_9FIRM|nr:PadR family transcriptional regulator [Vallitalea guaymasensis]QUH31127.1 helix-turn-helix transcriptional regulator [Vallitalea guaymasensis]